MGTMNAGGDEDFRIVIADGRQEAGFSAKPDHAGAVQGRNAGLWEGKGEEEEEVFAAEGTGWDGGFTPKRESEPIESSDGGAMPPVSKHGKGRDAADADAAGESRGEAREDGDCAGGEDEEDDGGLEIVKLEVEGGGTVHILGTAHVSEQCCQDVTRTIRRVRPKVVALELCQARIPMLKPLPPSDNSVSAILKQLRTPGTNTFEVLYGWYLQSIAASLPGSISPGQDFRTGYDEAKRLDPKADIVLVDRPVDITVARMWRGLSHWEKVRLGWVLVKEVFSLPGGDELSELIEKMRGSDALTEAVAEFGKQFPSLLAPLMHERDLFLASRLHHHASKMASGQHMVAVIGAGHVPGIQQNWGKDIDVEALLTIPPLNPMPIYFKVMVAVGIGGCIALAAAASGAVLVCGARAASWGVRMLPARGVLRR